MATPKPVLISGAGISGLLLAHSLRSNKIPFVMYERDKGIAVRAQGYRLRISTDGINALKAILTKAEYDHLHEGTSATGGGGIHNMDAISGDPIKAVEEPSGGSKGPGLGGDVLGISRAYLRECLSKGEENFVVWGKQTVGYTLSDSGVKL